MSSHLWSDIRHAVRTLRRSVAFTTVALITFALGIGATTAIFSVAYGVLLRPFPYAHPDRLAAIWPRRFISNAELLSMQRNARSLSAVAAFSPGWGITMTGFGEPRQLDGARVSANFFQTLGVSPSLGRSFRPDESDNGRWDVAILSHALWIDHFGGDREVIGRVVDMDGRPHRIVGVMPTGFEAFQPHVEAWLPLEIDPASPFYTGAVSQALGRLAPGATFASATAELAALAPRMRAEFHYPDDYARGATVTGLHESLVGNARVSLLVLLGAVAFLMLIAVANVGNLMLVHATSRRRELAIRRALGASRGQIARQLLVQSLALAVAGGLLGLGGGVLGTRALKAILPATLPMLATVGTNVAVLAVCAAVAIGAGILFGVGPAVIASRVDPDSTLRAGASESSSRAHSALRQTLVIVEVALAVVLVVAAGLMAETLWRLGKVDLGFEPHRVLTFRIQPTSGELRSPRATDAYFGELTRRIAAIPGVQVVGASQHLPLSGYNWNGDLDIEARPIPSTASHPQVVWRSVLGDYFAAMRIPLVEGRLFNSADTPDAPQVVVIDASMAKRHWPGRDPIGERIKLGNGTNNQWATIVGVVGDVRSAAPDADPIDEAYRPNTQQNLRFMHLVVRTTADPLSVIAPVRAIVRSFDPTVPVAEVQSLDALFSTSIAPRRTLALLLGAFAVLGVVLGAVGIYGVISYAVGQRTRELGIRTALGAVERRITMMVIGEGLRSSGAGVIIGTVAAVVASRSLRTLVFGVSTADWRVYSAVAFVLIAVAVAASFVPARRAARVDPLVALRSE